ncbi:MAG: PEP-CTERM sorting domain-containing protein [Pirellulales bacterium]
MPNIKTALVALRAKLAITVFGSLTVMSLLASADEPYFSGLGAYPTFHVDMRLSRNGQHIVGISTRDSVDYPVRWTKGEPLLVLDFPGFATGVSNDGAVIVGADEATGESQSVAFRWTESGGVEHIVPGDPSTNTGASAITPDGNTVVGGYNGQAFRWTSADGLSLIPRMRGIVGSLYVGDVSADGQIVIGQQSNHAGGRRNNLAFQWTEATGTVELGPLPPGRRDSAAFAGTPDMAVIVGGLGQFPDVQVPARWTQATGWTEIPDLPDGNVQRDGPAYAYGVSADGSIVVGRGVDPSGPEPFIWDPVHGTRNLTSVLRADYGLAESLSGWNLTQASGISDDGRTIVGFGREPSGRLDYWVAVLGNTIVNQWLSGLNGVWSNAGNWSISVPNATDAKALFGTAISGPRTITADLPITIGRIGFDSPHSYTIAGPNPLTLDVSAGQATINVARGSHVIHAPVTLADHTVVTIYASNSNLSFLGGVGGTGALTKAGPGSLTATHIRTSSLTLTEGTITLQPGGGSSIVQELTITGTPIAPGKLDLGNNALIVNYTGTTPAGTVRQHLLAGRGGPGLGKTWNGNGITSSAAAAANVTEPESRSIGYAENSTLPLGPYTSFRRQPVDDTSILIAFTRTGDANLDGIVNDDDVTIVGASYAPGVSQPSWALGDFDYNGFVDDDDVTLLGAFYDPTAAPITAPADGVGSVAAVPEPSTMALLAALAVAAAFVTRFRYVRGARLHSRLPEWSDVWRPDS